MLEQNIMQLLDGMNIIIRTTKAPLKQCRTVSHGLSFQMFQKCEDQEELRSFINLWKLDLNKENVFERLVLFRSGFR